MSETGILNVTFKLGTSLIRAIALIDGVRTGA